MRVFLSHSSEDKPAVEKFARALRAHGIDAWFDKWEIGPGDDLVARINDGLDRADAGIIIFSAHSHERPWVKAEVSYLIYAHITEGKPLIPVVLGENPSIPPLLRPLARRGIDEVEAIVDALHLRSAGSPPLQAAERGRVERVDILLQKSGEDTAVVTVRIGGNTYAHEVQVHLTPALREAQAEFLRGSSAFLHRNAAAAAARSAREANLLTLGRELRALCLPGEAGQAIAALIDGCPAGRQVEVCFEAEGAALLGLPYEALRLPDERLLATEPAVVMLRQPWQLKPAPLTPLAGPLKILVAVGAPDEERTDAEVLDHERELQQILDAVEGARRNENAEVRILEVGSPQQIATALEADAYHVLHLSCHGAPGILELEDEDGRPVQTTAEKLIKPIKQAGRPLPLVLLNACAGGVEDETTASLAEALLRAGIPQVLAMQTAVTDPYATALAGAFYQHLARGEQMLPSRALAQARKALEKERLTALQQGGGIAETYPEYATAALYVAGAEQRLADFGLPKLPLRSHPLYEVAGPVPQLPSTT